MPRDSTFDLREGFDRVRWRDDEATVRRYYPGAAASPASGDDAATARNVKLAPGVVLQDIPLPVPSDGLTFSAKVGFEGQGVTQLRLRVQGRGERHAGSSAEEWNELLLARMSALADRLGFGPVDPRRSDQTWTVGRVKIHLWWDEDGPTLAFVPPKLGLSSTRRITRT